MSSWLDPPTAVGPTSCPAPPTRSDSLPTGLRPEGTAPAHRCHGLCRKPRWLGVRQARKEVPPEKPSRPRRRRRELMRSMLDTPLCSQSGARGRAGDYRVEKRFSSAALPWLPGRSTHHSASGCKSVTYFLRPRLKCQAKKQSNPGKLSKYVLSLQALRLNFLSKNRNAALGGFDGAETAAYACGERIAEEKPTGARPDPLRANVGLSVASTHLARLVLRTPA